MTNTSEQPDIHEHTVLITGATAGIGYQTARALAQRGAEVIITGREAGRGEKAAAVIQNESGHGTVRFLPADHSTVGRQARARQPRASGVLESRRTRQQRRRRLRDPSRRPPTATRPHWR